MSVVHSTTQSFRLLRFQTQEGRDSAVDANACCVLAGQIFSLRKYPQMKPIRYRTASGFSFFLNLMQSSSNELFVLNLVDKQYKISLHLGGAISERLRKAAEFDPPI
jgi:hypothetical protein